MGIFTRDIKNNLNLNFRKKIIRPFKEDESGMHALFTHLTCEDIKEEDDAGRKYSKREFDIDRSLRLHWILYHLQEQKKDRVEIFSVEERDQRKREYVIKTYIYDLDQDYIVVLEPKRKTPDYYLLTAYYLNRPGAKENMKRKLKNKLPEVY